ncbi:MAG: hypothetical protein RLZ10_1230 [Bacteroidota bacterium]|jgi:hypothetical protein
MSKLENDIKKINKLIFYLESKNKKYFDEEELDEEDLSEEGESTGGAAASTGYPTVTKWESGVTRGPANPIGNEKRQDKVNRGKANRLI